MTGIPSYTQELLELATLFCYSEA